MSIMDNFLEQSRKGYADASVLDKPISHYLEVNPITQETMHQWTIFARTVKTTIELIETAMQREKNMAKHHLFDKEPKI